MERYAVIENQTQFIPGDERSRSCPGHGYPDEWVKYQSFKEFKTKEEWEKWIHEALNPQWGLPKQFTPIVFRETKVNKSISISID